VNRAEGILRGLLCFRKVKQQCLGKAFFNQRFFAILVFEIIAFVFNMCDFLDDFVDFLLYFAYFEAALATFDAHVTTLQILTINFIKINKTPTFQCLLMRRPIK